MNISRISLVLAVVSASLLVAAGCAKTGTNTTTNDNANVAATNSTVIVNTNVPATNQTIDLSNTNSTVVGPAATVSITSSGFSPASVSIKVGQAVTWTNNDTTVRQPAVDPHPAHSNLSGFDSAPGLAPGQTYSYTFMKAGTWTYHDHLFLFRTGTVVVTP